MGFDPPLPRTKRHPSLLSYPLRYEKLRVFVRNYVFNPMFFLGDAT